MIYFSYSLKYITNKIADLSDIKTLTRFSTGTFRNTVKFLGWML